MLVLLIGMASNLDNTAIGLSYGARNVRIPWMYMLLMPATSFLAALLGGTMGSVLTKILGKAGTAMGSILLVGLGLFMIWRSFTQPRVIGRHMSFQKEPDIPELMVFVFAQSTTDITTGFGAGTKHMSILAVALSIGFFSWLFIVVPVMFARRWLSSRWLSYISEVAAGLMLIVIGLHTLT